MIHQKEVSAHSPGRETGRTGAGIRVRLRTKWHLAADLLVRCQITLRAIREWGGWLTKTYKRVPEIPQCIRDTERPVRLGITGGETVWASPPRNAKVKRTIAFVRAASDVAIAVAVVVGLVVAGGFGRFGYLTVSWHGCHSHGGHAAARCSEVSTLPCHGVEFKRFVALQKPFTDTLSKFPMGDEPEADPGSGFC